MTLTRGRGRPLKKTEVEQSLVFLCSPSALPLPSGPSLRFTLPLTAPPHTQRLRKGRPMATPANHTEENNTPPTTACPVWCIGHDADAPDKDNDHIHEATPALIPCITLERTTNETGTIHHHPTATELTLVRYQYPHDSDTWLYIGDGSHTHGLDITLESARRLVSTLARYVEDEG